MSPASNLPAGWPDGVARVWRDAVDSTNVVAADLVADGPVWVAAGVQTAGRGRRGRPWASPPGNLYATIAMRPEGTAPEVALRSFVAALALRDACVAVTGLARAFALKWPNDVLLNGGKLAGILLESAGEGGRVRHLCIGIGVNLISAPDAAAVEAGALRPVSLLAETGMRVAPLAFLDALAPAYAGWEAVYRTQGFAPVRAAWLAGAANLGQTIRARTGRQTQEGVFETVDDTGALVLGTDAGRIAIPAAEVFF